MDWAIAKELGGLFPNLTQEEKRTLALLVVDAHRSMEELRETLGEWGADAGLVRQVREYADGLRSFDSLSERVRVLFWEPRGGVVLVGDRPSMDGGGGKLMQTVGDPLDAISSVLARRDAKLRRLTDKKLREKGIERATRGEEASALEEARMDRATALLRPLTTKTRVNPSEEVRERFAGLLAQVWALHVTQHKSKHGDKFLFPFGDGKDDWDREAGRPISAALKHREAFVLWGFRFCEEEPPAPSMLPRLLPPLHEKTPGVRTDKRPSPPK